MVSRNLKTILGTIFLLLLCPLLASGVETLENPKGSVKLTKAQLRRGLATTAVSCRPAGCLARASLRPASIRRMQRFQTSRQN